MCISMCGVGGSTGPFVGAGRTCLSRLLLFIAVADAVIPLDRFHISAPLPAFITFAGIHRGDPFHFLLAERKTKYIEVLGNMIGIARTGDGDIARL